MTRHQPRIKGKRRDPLPACVLHELRREVELMARRHGVSRSWVIAVALGDQFGIDVVSYMEPKRKKKAA